MANKPNFKKPAAELFISAAEPEQKQEQPKKGHTSLLDMNVPKGFRVVKENKTERMQLLVRPTTKENLKKISAAEGVSMNDLVNQIFEDYIERKGSK